VFAALVRAGTAYQDQAVMTTPNRSDRRLVLVLAATALCYLIGYPLALVGHSAIGWIFVALGGPLLVALLAMVVHRLHLSSTASPGPSRTPTAPAGTPPPSPSNDEGPRS
jgi:hypothetical protein